MNILKNNVFRIVCLLILLIAIGCFVYMLDCLYKGNLPGASLFLGVSIFLTINALVLSSKI